MSRSRLVRRFRRGQVSKARRSLLDDLPKRTIGAEVGVWEGDFSSQILAVVRPTQLHLIDPWRFAGEAAYARAWYGGRIAKSQEDMDAIFERVLSRFALPISSGLVTVHRCESAEAATTFPDEWLDWAYIDGNHLYEYVKRDLDVFMRKVKHGGLIAGDDYAQSGWWEDGVRRAVDELVVTGGCEPVLLGEQFLLQRA